MKEFTNTTEKKLLDVALVNAGYMFFCYWQEILRVLGSFVMHNV